MDEMDERKFHNDYFYTWKVIVLEYYNSYEDSFLQ